MNRVETAGQLTASIAHEVRQPLGAMVANAGAGLRFLKANVPDLDEARRAFQKIVDDGHRTDDLIKNIRSIFNRGSTPQTKVDVNETIKQVLTITTRAIDSNKIALETSLMENPRPFVMANPVQLQQVIMNLIMNAVEAMSSSDQWALILKLKTAIDSTDTVVITVADSGPGIDPKVADRIFEPFLTTKSGGMGMGLSICKSIIEAHEGKLTTRPGEPRGTVFQIDLPLIKENDDAAVSTP
jgi:C4-dicarboxylate-specific signal transduction histidine kinase